MRKRILVDVVPITEGVGGSGAGIWRYAISSANGIDKHLGALEEKRLEFICLVDRSTKIQLDDIKVVRVPCVRLSAVVRLT